MENFILKRNKFSLFCNLKGINMNKTFLKLVFLNLIISTLLFISCSSTNTISKITPTQFDGVSQIKSGESANLNWQFDNAKNVYIVEKNRNYDPIDSTNIKIDSSSVFTFVVTNDIDTLIIPWKIYVYEQVEKIETGLIPEKNKSLFTSYINSNYLKGIKKYQSGNSLKYLKIMNYIYPYKNKNIIRAKGLVLDEFGNFISGYGTQESDFISINAESACEDNFQTSLVTEFKEIEAKQDVGLDFVLLLDNSSIAGDFFPIYPQITYFVTSLGKNDRFALYSFNQNFKEIISLRHKKNINEELIKPDKFIGLSAIYKSLKKSIDKLCENNQESQKVIVLIAYSTDNASIVYDRNDIIDLAKEKNIPIYVIGVGNAVDSYSLQNLANFSGAKYYEIEENQLNDLQNILNEILFAQKSYYQFDINIPDSEINTCTQINSKIEFQTKNNKLKDSLIIPLIRQRHEFNYMALASFNYGDTIISSDYIESILNFALVLKKNPKLAIELIGNSSIEGNEQFSYNLAMKRAQHIRKILIQNGADPSKIRVRSDGANNPIYYLQESSWMQYYNRRVEIRWLDPELLPFEIIAQTFDTESEALLNVETWETRGYKAYYERYLQNNVPIYRVKLWGYAELSEAEKVVKKINKEFAIKSFVQ